MLESVRNKPFKVVLLYEFQLNTKVYTSTCYSICITFCPPFYTSNRYLSSLTDLPYLPDPPSLGVVSRRFALTRLTCRFESS